MIARPAEPQAARRPTLVVELAGPAGTGKTTLSAMLAQHGRDIRVAADISVRRPEHLAAFVRNAPPVLALLFPPRRDSRRFTWEEIKSVVYLKGWSQVLGRQIASDKGVILLDQGPVFRLATLHANAAEDARALLSRAEQALKPVESIFTEVSPTVGTHAGPGTVGLAFMAGM